jgi:hypothetical protein
MALSLVVQLPDELFLEVLDHIPGLPRERQKTIISLSLTCKRFRPICLEKLLVHPVLKLPHVAHLVHRYFLNPVCISKVQTLEIVSATPTTFQTHITRGTFLVPEKSHIFSNRKFQHFCTNIIHTCTSSPQKQSTWIRHLENYSFNAYLGVLLAMLPNLQSLLLGPNFLNDYPVFNPLICDRVYERNGILLALGTQTPYLDNVLNRLQQNLTSLELPVLWSIKDMVYSPQDEHPRARNIQNHLAPISQQNLLHFTNLKELTLPCFAFGQYRAIRPMWNMHAKSVLPPNLETLRIVDAEHVPLGYFLQPILESAPSLPSLKGVEVYFHNHVAYSGCTGREERLQVHARTAGVQLWMRHPKGTGTGNMPLMVTSPWGPELIFDALDAHGQPWRYGEEELLEFEKQAWKRRKEVEEKEVGRDHKFDSTRAR